MPRGSKPGERRGGRKRGTPNKLTATNKARLEEAFQRLGDVDALVEWASEERTEFYRLWGKLIPSDVKLEGTGEGGALVLKIVRE